MLGNDPKHKKMQHNPPLLMLDLGSDLARSECGSHTGSQNLEVFSLIGFNFINTFFDVDTALFRNWEDR